MKSSHKSLSLLLLCSFAPSTLAMIQQGKNKKNKKEKEIEIVNKVFTNQSPITETKEETKEEEKNIVDLTQSICTKMQRETDTDIENLRTLAKKKELFNIQQRTLEQERLDQIIKLKKTYTEISNAIQEKNTKCANLNSEKNTLQEELNKFFKNETLTSIQNTQKTIDEETEKINKLINKQKSVISKIKEEDSSWMTTEEIIEAKENDFSNLTEDAKLEKKATNNIFDLTDIEQAEKEVELKKEELNKKRASTLNDLKNISTLILKAVLSNSEENTTLENELGKLNKELRETLESGIKEESVKLVNSISSQKELIKKNNEKKDYLLKQLQDVKNAIKKYETSWEPTEEEVKKKENKEVENLSKSQIEAQANQSYLEMFKNFLFSNNN